LPSYSQLVKVPVVKRDLTEFPEDAEKTMNVFEYTTGFSDGDGTNKVVNRWSPESFFINKEPTTCEYTCELMSADCMWPYTATKHVTMDSDYKITVMTDIVDGYNTTFCMKCSNNWDSIEQGNINFVQTEATNWVMVGVIIVAVLGACLSILCYFIGKKRGTEGIEMGDTRNGYSTGRQESTGANTDRTEK